MDRERLKGNLDLLLSVLSSGPAHGYAIISALRDRSGGTFDLPEGTIYPALHRLEDAGLLASTWAWAEGRRRRVCGLTDRGAAALADQQTEWRRFAGGVHAVLGWAAQGVWPPAAGLARAEPGVAGMSAAVGMSEAGSDLIAGYLDQMRAGLRVPADEAELILAEAEDHLCETAAAGREVGMTEREAQEAAISSFGPVRAVVRAHHARRGWLAAAAEAGLAAWKLAAVLLLTSGVTGLAIDTILRIWPPVVTVTPGSQTPCWPCLPTQAAVIINPVWLAWAVAAVGGAILLACCGLILRVRRRRGRGMLLGGFFPMVAAGFFGAIALALTTLSAGGVGVPVPGGLAPGPGVAVAVYPAVAVYLAVAAYLTLAVGYAIRMARTLRRERRDQVGTFGRVLGDG